jgi:myo-inositol-1(or 4)-monophosphatase
VALLGKYSKFAGAGDKAAVRAAVAELAAVSPSVSVAGPAAATDLPDAPF